MIDAGPGTGHLLDEVIRYEYSAPVTDLRQRLVVLPPVRHGAQELCSSDFAVSGAAGAAWSAHTDRWGNTVVDVTADAVDAAVEFRVRAQSRLVPDRCPAALRHAGRYLAPTRLTTLAPVAGPDADPTTAALVEAAAHTDPAGICTLVYRSLRYVPGATGVRTTAAEALAGGGGVCQDLAQVMVAVCRAVGLPARYVSGHLTGEGASHAWVETLRPVATDAGPRFVVEAWDPTHDRSADDGRYLTVATGRDYDDVAPMSGTFEADDLVDTRLVVTKNLRAA